MRHRDRVSECERAIDVGEKRERCGGEKREVWERDKETVEDIFSSCPSFSLSRSLSPIHNA